MVTSATPKIAEPAPSEPDALPASEPRGAPRSKPAAGRTWLYSLSLIAPLATLGGNLAGGAWVFTAGALVWGLLPLLEGAWRSPAGSGLASSGGILDPKTAALPDRAGYNLLLWVHVVVQLLCVGALVALVVEGAPLWVLGGAIFSTGTTTGSSAFIVSHELMHRPTVKERLGSWILLLTAFNTHFHVEHVHVHHKKVGTDDDPASARADDNPFLFVVKAAVGQLLHAWQVAIRKWPEQRAATFRRGARTPYLVALSVALGINLAALGGVALFTPAGALAVIGQAIVATFLLNLVNYVEHWGLRRTEDEPVRSAHSWDTDSLVTRYTLFDLGMHADHHCRASKPYWRLVEHDTSPRMPVGLYAATMLALVPPLFRRTFAAALPQRAR